MNRRLESAKDRLASGNSPSVPAFQKRCSLKELSAHLGLSQSTVSRVVNHEATAHRIAEATQKRVLEAAERMGYEASAVARGLRQKRSFTVGVLVPEISEGYSTAVLGGIEDALLKEGLFYFVASHRHRQDLLQSYPRMMITHAVDGIIAVDTAISDSISVPVVMVSGHRHRSQAISVELDHMQAARQALGHLKSLGHSKIAFIKGQAFSSDTALRWKSIRAVARELDIPILPQLVTQLQSPEPGSEPGHLATQVLLERKVPFSAIFAFNDLSAIGAIHALQQASLRVPKDVSIVGFDDILFASTCYPPLTTVRQPLREMGRMAADTLLGLIRGENGLLPGSVITVHPELIIRKSTARHVD